MRIMVGALFVVLNLSFALFIVFLTLAFLTGAPFVPSTNKTAHKMIELARLKQGQKVYDLGSGDGRLLFLAADKGARAVGFEINPFLVFYSKLVIWLRQTKNITVSWKNFWGATLSDADVIFVYLLPWRMQKLQRKLEKELKPGALVVSNSFVFPNWNIVAQDISTHVYVFEVDRQIDLV